MLNLTRQVVVCVSTIYITDVFLHNELQKFKSYVLIFYIEHKMHGVISTNVWVLSLPQIFVLIIDRDIIPALVPLILFGIRASDYIFKHLNILGDNTSMNRVLSIVQTHKGREMKINHEQIH